MRVIITPIENLKQAREAASFIDILITKLEAEARITIEDIEDGAEFWSCGTEWRRVVELHPGRFMVLDRFGNTQQPLTTAGHVLDLALCCGYTKEKQG
jgi:hypothetical protein